MKTFKLGGVHSSGNKLSAGSQIQTSALPTEAIIPLSQHIGAPAKPIVAKGDKVKVGQLIAEASSFMSANIHSSVSGTVSKIEDTIDVTGYKRPAIYITVEGDEWDESIIQKKELLNNCTLSAADIIAKIKDMGIVGMGGATFPTHVKLNVPTDKKIDTLIVNGVECEPFLTADHRLMLEHGAEIVLGCKILMKALNVQQTYIGIESNKPDAIENLSSIASNHLGIEVVPLKMKYPQGGEKQLIEAIVGRKVQSGKLPADVGVVVQNIGTVFAVYEAVQKNKPLIERVITVTGEVKKPSNFLVRIGTPMAQLVEQAGGYNKNVGKIVAGGPMMGRAIVNDKIPVTKGSSGLLIISEDKAERKEEKDCIRCGKCVSACPMGLEPYLLSTLVELRNWEKAAQLHIMDCIECGCCTFSCPANRPLIDLLKFGKFSLRKQSTKK